jgi:hypothetical protein
MGIGSKGGRRMRIGHRYGSAFVARGARSAETGFIISALELCTILDGAGASTCCADGGDV